MKERSDPARVQPVVRISDVKVTFTKAVQRSLRLTMRPSDIYVTRCRYVDKITNNTESIKGTASSQKKKKKRRGSDNYPLYRI